MKKLRVLCGALAAALMISLIPAAYADSTSTDDGIVDIAEASVNAQGDTLYNDGKTVFNNGGTVYNNGGTVFNNGGVVFNNDGTVYNNGGVVYNNSGTVHNNSGRVEDNSVAAAAVTGADKLQGTADGEADAEKDAKSEHTLTLAEDYSLLADITGLEADGNGSYTMQAEDKLIITPKAGIALTDATTTAGACTMSDSGIVTLDRVDRDGKLTLKFKLDAPVAAPGAGSYGDDVLVTLTAAENAKIYYTLDGSAPSEKSKLYAEPFELESSCVLKAVAVLDGAKKSDVTEEVYIFPTAADIDFGSAEQGYKAIEAKPIVVKNTGLGDVKIVSVKLEGDDKADFTLNTEKGGTVPTGQSDAKTWTVAPKRNLAPGKYETETVFTFDSGDTMDVDISFTVKATAAKKA